MPIYDIVCKKCKHEEEKAFIKYNGLDSYVCPNCGKTDWMKKPCRTAWFIGKKSLQKDSASEVAELGYGNPAGDYHG